MANIKVNNGFVGTTTSCYGYVQGNTDTSTAFGVDDSDSGKFKIQSLTTRGAVPTGAVQMTIDPSTDGNITFFPNGIGNLDVTTGDIQALEGDFVGFDNTATTFGSQLLFRKTRSGGIITSGDFLGAITFTGFDGNDYQISSAIRCISTGTINPTNGAPSHLLFLTKPNSSQVSTQRMQINSSGGIIVRAPDSGLGIEVQGGGISVTGNSTITGSLSTTTTMTAGTGLTVTVGDLSVSAGNINLPTTASTSVGVLKVNTARFLHSFGTNNTFVGSSAGNFTLTTVSAIQNTGFGAGALTALTTGSANTSVGYLSSVSLTQGTENTACGQSTLQQITTGARNIALGINAGFSLTVADSDNIVIGNLGVAGDTHTIRVGRAGSGNYQQNKCFIHGIRGITTVNADAIAVLVDSAGQLGTVSSSIRFKENVKDMGDVSSAILKLRPVTFNYKSHDVKSIQYGLIAEEVEKVIPRLVVYDEGRPSSVKYQDLPALLLNEIQKLNKRIEQLEKKCSQTC